MTNVLSAETGTVVQRLMILQEKADGSNFIVHWKVVPALKDSHEVLQCA